MPSDSFTEARIQATRRLRKRRWFLRRQIKAAREYELKRCWRAGFGKPANIADFHELR
jgi:hypothetical protein